MKRLQELKWQSVGKQRGVLSGEFRLILEKRGNQQSPIINLHSKLNPPPISRYRNKVWHDALFRKIPLTTIP